MKGIEIVNVGMNAFNIHATGHSGNCILKKQEKDKFFL